MRIKLFAACILTTTIASAAIPLGGWYSSLFGGYTYLPDNINRSYLDVYWNNIAFKNGFNAGGRVGYFSNPIRYEAEYTFLQAVPNSFFTDFVLQERVFGRSSGNLLMLNIYYDTQEVMPCVSAFAGIGMGYAFLQTNFHTNRPLDLFLNVHENSFAYQGTLGLTYNFVENYALNIGYRYVATSERQPYGKIFQAHLMSAGVVYRFDSVD